MNNFWQTLSPPWQVCIDEAWQAYRAGSLPIGAAITNTNGSIVARGRNRIFEKEVNGEFIYNSRTAHAEMNALFTLDESQNPSGTCTLYTTTEPCPMCLGAIRISRMSECHFASRDPIAGSAALMKATPFMQEANIKMVSPHDPVLENILAAMLIEKLLYAHAQKPLKSIPIREEFFPEAGLLARDLFESGELAQWAKTGISIAHVVNVLAKRL
ncbi:MAG: nucleoside deaminase [Anaerolineae bacterium]|nr:nucleoside deaminase [Anaerolineae bacterium]